MEPTGSDSREDSWAEVLSRIASGDQGALGLLYDRYSSPLFSVALKMLANSNEAEEAVQDVFVSVWKKAGTFQKGRAKVFTWLTVMVRNKCLDRLRAKSRRIPTSDILGEDDPKKEVVEGHQKTAAEEMLDTERSGLLKGAVDQLPDDQKLAINLAFFTGMSHSEIGERLGVSIGTIKSRIRYGMQKLKLMIGGPADA